MTVFSYISSSNLYQGQFFIFLMCLLNPSVGTFSRIVAGNHYFFLDTPEDQEQQP